MFPKVLKAIRTFRAEEACLVPKTAEKNNDAASCFELLREAFGTESNSISEWAFLAVFETYPQRNMQCCKICIESPQ